MPDEIAGRRCATHDISTGDRLRMAEIERRFLAETRIAEADLRATIKVAFIHIVDGRDGKITKQQREEQISVLNRAYDKIGLTFNYDETQTVEVDDAVFFRMGHESARERQCKTQHYVLDPTTGLNFYTAAPGGGLLGWATFPHEMEGDPTMDGVVILHSTLPGGSAESYNIGMTAAHEIGHWLGLFHTFQDGCFGNGDEVDDTPNHAGPNYGKPDDAGQPYNLCPNAPAGALCPIHNIMNYVDDAWMKEFTAGQKTRIWAQIGMFRTGLIPVRKTREAATAASVVW